MRENISYELNRIFGNNLSEQGIEVVVRYLRNRNISFSAIQVELIQKILDNEVVKSVLAPKFEFSITSWVDDKRIVLYEENSEIIKLSKDIWDNKNVNILNENFLNTDIKEKFSAIVLTCPSGSMRRDGQRNIRLEIEYISKCLNCLSDNGTFVVTVPSNFQTAPIFSDIRDRILNDHSLEVVLNCGHLFNNTGLEWYTLVISKRKQTKSVYFTYLNNNVDEVVNNYKSKIGEFWVSAEELYTRWDITYLDPKYASLREKIYSKNTIKLGNISRIIRGVLVRQEDRLDKGDYMILTPRLIRDNTIINDESNYFYCSTDFINSQQAEKAVLQEGDIVISLIGNISWSRYTDTSKKMVANQHMAIIRTKPEYSNYLEVFFGSTTGQEYLDKQTRLFSRGGVFNSIKISDLQKFVVPDIKTLEVASKYQYEHNVLKRIANTFKQVGWEVKEEYFNGHAILDIALFYNGKLYGAVEVKNYKYDDLKHGSKLIQQLNKIKRSIDFGSLFVFLNEELYVYDNNKLVELPEIPTPSTKAVQQLNSLYTEVEIDKSPIIVKQLPYEAISLSDSLIIELLISQKEQLKRIEGKIDSIAEQINNYQSLVEKQIDRAIGEDEVERIIQSFTDECIERIEKEFNKNHSEQEYYVEENKLKVSLGESAWNKLSESSKSFLASSKVIYNSLISSGNAVDYSGVCLLVTKALEVEMSNRFCKNYIRFLTEKYPGKDNLSLWPTTMLNRYGKKNKPKDFTLGSVAYILCYRNVEGLTEKQINNNKSKLMEYAKSELFLDEYDDGKISDFIGRYAEWVEEVRTDYRNPSAHTNELKKVDAENCFDLVTDVEKILKVMMDSFKE